MNYINCKNSILPNEMRKAVSFWAKNTFQHIESLLNPTQGNPAVLNCEFRNQLESLSNIFKKISDAYSAENNTNRSVKPDAFFKENQKLINLLEHIKFEAYNGYPDLQQIVFHYLYEQRYINAIFAVNSNSSNVIITTRFNGFGNYPYICICNQMYFWSVIGAMHPSLLMDTDKFYEAITGSSKTFLMETINRFNALNFRLGSIKKPITRAVISEIFRQFEMINASFLNFLQQSRMNSPKVFTNPYGNGLPRAFYNKLQHMIDEHTLVSELNNSISQKLL